MGWSFVWGEQYIIPDTPRSIGHPDFWATGPASAYNTEVEEIGDTYWETCHIEGPNGVAYLVYHDHRPYPTDDPGDFIQVDASISASRYLTAITKRQRDGVIENWINLLCDLAETPWYRIQISGPTDDADYSHVSTWYELPKLQSMFEVGENPNEVYIFFKLFGRADGLKWLPYQVPNFRPIRLPVEKGCFL